MTVLKKMHKKSYFAKWDHVQDTLSSNIIKAHGKKMGTWINMGSEVLKSSVNAKTYHHSLCKITTLWDGLQDNS